MRAFHLVSEPGCAMAPSSSQRLEAMEEKLAGLEDSMRGMVGNAVEAAITAMSQSLTAQLEGKQAALSQQQQEALDAATARLEGRINRSREQQEGQMNIMRESQRKFQEELQATVARLGNPRATLEGNPEAQQSTSGENNFHRNQCEEEDGGRDGRTFTGGGERWRY